MKYVDGTWMQSSRRAVLFLLAFILNACSNGNPVIKSLGLQSGEITLYQSKQLVTNLLASSAGELNFEINCASGMTSIQYALKPDGPWMDIEKIDCSSGRAPVALVLNDTIQDKIYLRTAGSWGKSAVKEVSVEFKMNVIITGVPEAISNQSTFRIDISGDSLLAYKYSFGPSSSLDCSSATSYSDERSISMPLSNIDVGYGSLADGTYRLCVLVKNRNGVWAKPLAAESREWSKDTIAQPATLTKINASMISTPYPAQFQGNAASPVLVFQVIGDEGAKIELHVNNNCSSLLGSGIVSNQVATVNNIPTSGTLILAQGSNKLWVRTVDALMNISSCSYLLDYQLDSVAPTITSITGPATAVYTVGQSLGFDVNLSESVGWTKGAGSPTLKLKVNTSVRDAVYMDQLSTALKLHFRYTVQAGDDDNDGVATESPLFIPAEISIADSYGNNLTPTFTAQSFPGVKIDTAGPTLTSVTFPTDGWYPAGANIHFVLNFSESVTVAGGTPQIEVAKCLNSSCESFDSSYLRLTLSSGSGTNDLYFTHTIPLGEEAPYGLKLTKILLGSASLKDSQGNNADLSYLGAGIVQAGIKFDGSAPTLSGVQINSGASYTTNKNLTLSLTGKGDSGGSGLSKVLVNETSCSYMGAWTEYTNTDLIEHVSSSSASGTVTVYVKLKDAAGNITSGTGCVSDSISLDLDPPVITSFTLEAGAEYTNKSALTLTASISDVGSGVAYYLAETGVCGSSPQTGQWVSSSSGPIITIFNVEGEDGTKTVSLWVKDKSGLKTCLSDSIIRDTAVPIISSFATIPIDNTLVKSTTVSVSSWAMIDSSPQYYYCWVEQNDNLVSPSSCTGAWMGPVAADTSPASYTLTTQGPRDVYLLVKDLAGNMTSKMLNVTLDSIAPTLSDFSLKSPSQRKSSVLTPTFTVSGSFAVGDTIRIYKGDVCSGPADLYGEATATSTTSNDISLTTSLAEGVHYFSVAASDAAGNSSCQYYATAAKAYEVDVTAPTISSVTVGAATGWSVEGDILSFTVSLSEPCVFSGVTAVSVPIVVGASDKSAACTVPNTLSSSLTCTYTIGNMDLDIDGVATSSGSLALTGTIKDEAGNSLGLALPNPQASSYKVDAVVPDVSGLAINDGEMSTDLTASLPISWNSATDMGSGITNYRLEILDDQGAAVHYSDYATAPTIPIAITGLSLVDKTTAGQGFHLYRTRVTVRDEAGNQVSVLSNGWKVVQFSEKASISHANVTDGFGKAMALSEDGQRLIVGLEDTRKVRIFKVNSETDDWILLAEIHDPSEIGSSRFGQSVAVKVLGANNYLYAVGSPGDGNSTAGSVPVFREENGLVSQHDSPLSSNLPTSTDDEFGYSVKFVAEFLAVGSPGADTFKSDGGAVFVFPWTGPSFGVGVPVMEGAITSGRLGQLLAATMQTGSIPVVFSSEGKSIVYSRNTTGTWEAPTKKAAWGGGSYVLALDAHGSLVVASEGSRIYYSLDGGSSFVNNVSASVSGLAIVADPNPVSSANLGAFVVSIDSISGSPKVELRKLSGSSLFLKQSLLLGLDLGADSGIVGLGGRTLLLGQPSAGKIIPFR